MRRSDHAQHYAPAPPATSSTAPRCVSTDQRPHPHPAPRRRQTGSRDPAARDNDGTRTAQPARRRSISAAKILISWTRPGRFRSEAAFSGGAPIPASSGLTSGTATTARANANSTERCTPSCRPEPEPTPTPAYVDRRTRARPPARQEASSNARSPAGSTNFSNSQPRLHHRPHSTP
jgi:hypothetical protein